MNNNSKNYTHKPGKELLDKQYSKQDFFDTKKLDTLSLHEQFTFFTTLQLEEKISFIQKLLKENSQTHICNTLIYILKDELAFFTQKEILEVTTLLQQ